ncbi:MAG: PQQ-binding-like beta-propeller repeat protein [Bacteroidales bacterium]
MENNQKQTNINVRLWSRIALIAGAFGFIISLLLIANYIQINKIDPINTKTINLLVERLNQNPDDEELRSQIRELDLLARKAYFTSQWQVRTGGYLLLISIIIIVISVQLINSAKNKVPVIADFKNPEFLAQQVITRKWVSISGISLVAIALLFAFLTHHQLGKNLALAITPGTDSKTLAKSATDNIQDTSAGFKTETPVADTLNQNADTTKLLSEFPTYEETIKNFPAFRGPGGLGIAYQKSLPTSWNGTSGKNIKWKLAIPLPGFNSPIIWEDKIFISGADATKREVYCIDRNTGKLLWKVLVSGIQGSPSGAPKVSNDTGLAAPSLTTDGRRVYAVFANGDIIAIDMEGKKVWAKNLGMPANHYGHSSSLLVIKNMLIVQYDQKNGPKVMALNSKTGQVAWSTNREVKISWTSPVIAYTGKQNEVILSAEPYVAGYNPFTGKENWRIDCIFGEVGPSVAYADGIVFAQNEYARLVAIKLGEKPEILWEDTEYLSDIPSPVATKKFLFQVTSYGMVVCYEAKTGKKLWEKDFGGSIFSSPILAEGKIYLIDKKGVTHIFSASETYNQIGESPLGESVVASPAFADGQVIIRGEKNLYCIGK